jgi:hypothetical protein
MILYDDDCWELYPNLRNYFDKYWVAKIQGLKCGDSSVPVLETGFYCVRPVVNLHGMSKDTRFQFLEKGDIIEDGFFWCEYLHGNQYSIDYKKDKSGNRTVHLAVEASIELKTKLRTPYKFKAWHRLSTHDYIRFPFPAILEEEKLKEVETINVEYIGNTIIEVHLRGNPDFEGHNYDTLWVAWETDTPEDTDGWTFIADEDHSGVEKRLGFYCK